MNNKAKTLVFTVLYLLLSNTFIYAQHNDKHPEQGSHSSKHHIALFNGATTNFSHNSTSYTIGIDYEYRLSELVGLGLLVEYIAAKPEELLTGVIVFAHPYKGFKFLAAPLVIFSGEHHEIGHEANKETNFAFRIGAGYDFHFGKLSVGPSVNLDLGKTESLNYGISVGFGL